jgi:uncharacterized protein (TIGR02646 family)
MIRVIRTAAPAQLTPEKHDELRDRYLELTPDERRNRVAGSEPWRKKFISTALLAMSQGKCVYCEVKLNEDGVYMTADHWLPKHQDAYPHLVVTWTNLLPACTRCNQAKDVHDPSRERIVNPCEDDPRDYLEWEILGRIAGRDTAGIGHQTREALNLNEQDLVVRRLKLVAAFTHSLERLERDARAITNTTEGYTVRNIAQDLLSLAQPDRSFSALLASTLLSSPNWGRIRSIMDERELWNAGLEELEQRLSETALQVRQPRQFFARMF